LVFGLEVWIPNPEDREEEHRIIFGELYVSQIRPESKARLARIMDKLAQGGAEGIILGCTELGLLTGAESRRS